VSNPLVTINNVKKYFPIDIGIFRKTKEFVYAVDDINLILNSGDIVGLVGESGCGKTTLAKCILYLIKPTSGKIVFDGLNLKNLNKKELRKLRSKMQIIFQDPFSSLNPRITIKETLSEPFEIHKIIDKREINERVISLLQNVGLTEDHLYRFPHEFSGGQRQRIAIARAIALNPKLLVLDEPTSSLDVSVQARILNLFKRIQKDMNLTYLFISHDFSVINFMCKKINVMYLGKIVESASSQEIIKEAKHPYTRALISAIPRPNPHIATDIIFLEGDPPSPVNLPGGCRFNPRCKFAKPICKKSEPKLKETGHNHFVACHLI